VNYLDSLTNYERVLGVAYNKNNFSLARMNRILRPLGNPHKAIKTVHIAGTKGKGSTATMLAEMLAASGLRVGLYTSPHILDIRERIRINRQKIPESQFARVVVAAEHATKKAKIVDPTYFEVLTAAAFYYFADQKVDIAVIETGLGGRLDSTNVITPEVVGITNISMDHMAQLGPDLASIAREKAAVMKKGVAAVSAPQPEKVRDVLVKAAKENGADLRFANENVEFSYRFEFSRAAGRHARICVTTPRSRFEHLQVPLFGEHQAMNCCLALNMLDSLKSRGFPVDDQQAVQGLSRVELLGRMQLISEEPRILVDGAHNAASVDALMRAIGQHIPYDSMIVIFACQKDKDIPGMLRRLQVGADKMIFTYSGSPRTADAEELAAQYMELSGKMAQVARTLDDAMQIAQSAITREDLICITGSFYIVAQAMRKYGGKPSAAISV
jgi:dihydrofolate synthase/folylpolyglutamate synthase